MANPRFGELQRLRDRIAQAAPEVTAALDESTKDFGAGKTWSGTAADAFAKEIAGRKKRLDQLASDLRAAIDHELRNTPEHCTPEEAANWRALRRGAI